MKMKFFQYFLFFAGLTFFGLGNAIAVKVKYVGLHPWEVLNVALYQHFGLTIGTWGVICGLILIFISFFVARSYISIGTILNALCIGPIMDFFLWLDILPKATGTWLDYLILLSGIMITGIGGGMYVAAGIGAGPRDGFMLSISDKTKLSVSQARIIVESIVLMIGLLLSGPVFIATFLYTFIQSPIFHHSLKLFKSLVETVKRKNSKTQEGIVI
ncbi:YitT family protein [Bacillus sp. ISL-40]|uniref:YczE/YyaS/YitT family protein n=1 Tax=unclassified Bacillus (in: firmicutes) TaxID=185979 RepID=UPI001BE8D913|nr:MULTISPECIES: YitT family protein [unclassified Bacillus (in: firmicutes)]MBT2696980.1 YitT family protein [Bacillus sp. ISL-40]MBT2741468.1 YitT family protein [Bacillus sp. ISL-77]